MWVKMTTEEMAASRRRKIRSKLFDDVIMTLFATTVVSFIPSWRENQNLHFRPLGEAVGRFAIGVVPVFVLFVILRRFEGRKPVPTMICPKCEATKFFDGNSACPCGGSFEFLETMTWRNEARFE